MMDNPDLTREEAEQKLLRIKEEKMKRMETFAVGQIEGGEGDDEDEDEGEDESNGE